MGYSKEVYRAVKARFVERRAAAFEEAEQRRLALYREDKRFAELDQKLQKAARALILASAPGGTEAARRSARAALDELRAQKAELLVEKGLSPDYLEPRFSCARCQDSGEVDGVRCACFDRALKSEAFLRTGLGGVLSAQTFESFDPSLYPQTPLGSGTVRSYMEKVFLRCRQYAAQFSERSPSLLLSGATGLGKTHLSSAIGRVVSDSGRSVVYDTAGEIFAKLDDRRFGRRSEEETEDYYRCDLLIVDDLGSELTTALTVAHLFSLVNTRLNSGRQLIINTNLSPEELRERYEEKVASRLIGSFQQIFFYGRDIREIRAGIR